MSETNNTPIMTDAFTDSNYRDFFIELYGEDEMLRLRPFAPRLGFMVFITTPPIYYTRFILGDGDPFYQ